MFKVECVNIESDKQINIGKKYKMTGEIRYGLERDDFNKLTQTTEQIKEEYLSEVIVLDLTELKRWDSLGIRALVPAILKLNEKLEEKGRILISVIGNRESDLYRAAKDKHPEISQATFPWYPRYDDFVKVNL